MVENVPNVVNVALIGAGNMGSGIAQKYAMHGYKVTVVDQNSETLKKSQSIIESALKHGVAKNVLSEQEALETLKRLSFSTNTKDCHNAELVIEAIFEDLALKQELFANLEEAVSSHTLLATNTSSLTVEEIGKYCKGQNRILGLHYFYPPARNRLVEVIGTKKTSSECIAKATSIQNSIKKTPIYSKDAPGFIVNRFFVPWLNESLRIAHEGRASIATIEHAAKQFFNIPLGPFELMNVTGLPITFHACNALKKSLGNFYAPSPLIEDQLEKRSTFNLQGDVDQTQLVPIGLRLLFVVSALVFQIVKEEICDKNSIDLGAKVGLLWPKGPFELFNAHKNEIKSMFDSMAKACPNLDTVHMQPMI